MMNVLVSTLVTQGDVLGDFSWMPEGELVSRQGIVCASERSDGTGCGCGRAFSGLFTRKGNSSAMVVEMDINEHGWRRAVLQSLDDGGWSKYLSPSDCAEIIDEWVYMDLHSIRPLAPGTILGRRAWLNPDGSQEDCFLLRRSMSDSK